MQTNEYHIILEYNNILFDVIGMEAIENLIFPFYSSSISTEINIASAKVTYFTDHNYFVFPDSEAVRVPSSADENGALNCSDSGALTRST